METFSFRRTHTLYIELQIYFTLYNKSASLNYYASAYEKFDKNVFLSLNA